MAQNKVEVILTIALFLLAIVFFIIKVEPVVCKLAAPVFTQHHHHVEF